MNLYRAIRNLGETVQVELLEKPVGGSYDAIFLPGVGHFEEAARRLQKSGMDEFIKVQHERGTFIVGVCLGMQILFEESEESSSTKPVRGLGLLRGRVVKLKAKILPHMGWNQVEFSHEPFKELDGRYFYFVHSYRVLCDDSLIIATCTYDEEFPAVVMKNNIVGAQFHPEKSHTTGKMFLKKVLECVSSRR